MNNRRNSYEAVDQIESIDIEHLTFSDLYPLHGTGRPIVKSSGWYKTYSYRVGVGTHIGDIEESLWCRLVRGLIKKHGEQELYQQLQEWVKENCLWLKTRSDIEVEALKLHAMRIFDCQEWVGFVAFNRKYRPEALKNAKIVRVLCHSCSHSGDVTQVQIDRAYKGQISCPVCRVWSEFHCTPPEEVSRENR